MADINQYELDSSIDDNDKIIGTDASMLETKNFSISDLRVHIFGGYGQPGQILGIDASGRLTWVDCN
jgi:hypothetical protein